jgi:redox-sensitive bicupin YhaK (pirin superfamily)
MQGPLPPVGPVLEQLAGRQVPLGGNRAMSVQRSLPQRDRRTVGPWCFVDHYGPATISEQWQMDVPPHPHTGLCTVSWLLAGQVRHCDSLGNEVIVAPGELNLMTSGHGISHSEQSVGGGTLHGVQLWVALPEPARDMSPHFEHHPDLPVLAEDGAEVTVVLGAYRGHPSPGVTYSPVVGLQVVLHRTTVLALDPAFEHAVLLLSGAAEVEGEPLVTGSLLYVGTGRHALALAGDAGSALLVIGGEPLDEQLVMWWNFVGRSHEDIVRARQDWQDQRLRFGHVRGYDGPWLPAPALPAVALKPRPRVRPPSR